MEYTLNVLYCEEQPTLRYHFYSALLCAEARWLKLLLKERISQLRSDTDARLLLCEVLEEVYDTGVLVDEASRRGLSAELCAVEGSIGFIISGTDYKFRAFVAEC